jgi:tRNA 2-thiouridine synthesizing protein C
MTETEQAPKRFMYVNRKAPYGSIYAQESLEVVVVAGAYEQDVTVVFLDDGVYQILKNQDPRGTEMKNFSPAFRALEQYDITKLYVEKESLDARGLSAEDLLVDVRVMPASEIADVMTKQDIVLSF